MGDVFSSALWRWRYFSAFWYDQYQVVVQEIELEPESPSDTQTMSNGSILVPIKIRFLAVRIDHASCNSWTLIRNADSLSYMPWSWFESIESFLRPVQCDDALDLQILQERLLRITVVEGETIGISGCRGQQGTLPELWNNLHHHQTIEKNRKPVSLVGGTLGGSGSFTSARTAASSDM
ncbi:hypothetical protein Tco_1493810 [Tanacetum coccineum]